MILSSRASEENFTRSVISSQKKTSRKDKEAGKAGHFLTSHLQTNNLTFTVPFSFILQFIQILFSPTIREF
jgi:hypothetical protein